VTYRSLPARRTPACGNASMRRSARSTLPSPATMTAVCCLSLSAGMVVTCGRALRVDVGRMRLRRAALGARRPAQLWPGSQAPRCSRGPGPASRLRPGRPEHPLLSSTWFLCAVRLPGLRPHARRIRTVTTRSTWSSRSADPSPHRAGCSPRTTWSGSSSSIGQQLHGFAAERAITRPCRSPCLPSRPRFEFRYIACSIQMAASHPDAS
jgi:hypothetical protein